MRNLFTLTDPSIERTNEQTQNQSNIIMIHPPLIFITKTFCLPSSPYTTTRREEKRREGEQKIVFVIYRK